MSVEKVLSPTDGSVIGYKVRWRDTQGSSRRRTVKLWRDAVALDAEIKRKKVMGELVTHEKGKIKLCDFWDVYVKQYGPNVSARTLESYAWLWSKHVAPALGGTAVRSLDAESIAALSASMLSTHSSSTVRKVHAVLHSVLQRAVEWGYIATNPASGVRKPKLVQRRGIAVTTQSVAALCAELDLRSAVIVRVLVGTGLRPGELRALKWEDIKDGIILITKAVSRNEIGPTKTGRSRSVRPTDDASRALAEWSLSLGRPDSRNMVFGAVVGRGLWTDDGYRMWVKKVFKPAAERAGLKGLVPYDLRHTYASLRIAEGADILYLASELGHSPTMTLTVYGHLLSSGRSGPETANVVDAARGR